MNAIRFLCCLGLLVLLICVPASVLLAKNRSLGVNETSGIATAVVVDDQALVHTTQLLPLDGMGQIAVGDLNAQTAQVVANLREALQAVGSDLAQIARLNVYLDSEVTETVVQKHLTRELLGEVNPAVTYVVTALANDDALLAVDAIASVPGSDAVEVVRDIYAQLGEVLRPVGSDLKHLVKATYYVADGEVSKALNDVRPSIYDPERPPAASKALIAGTGDAKRTIVIDMIAVPRG
jgi:enamine deaminase RidA (YjgF/YER057c/UK114 family)